MHDAVKRVVDPFLAQADAALGDGFSAVLYGSAARGDWVEGRSNVNLLLILDDVAPARLRALSPAFGGWRKAAQEPPLLLSRAEWQAATDVFPIEITDMRTAYQVLRGPDPLQGLVVRPADLRRALEREFRGKLVRLRQGYATLADDPEQLGALLTASLPTMLVLYRGLLALVGRPAPREPLELVVAAAQVIGVDGEPFEAVARRRGEKRWRCEARECEAYLDAVARTVRYVDQLHPGDQ
jgi:hypothetical protein